MDVLRKPQTVDSPVFIETPKWAVTVFAKSHCVDISTPVFFWYNSAQTVRAERKNTMARKPLNAEEIAELRSNPYVAKVIGNMISFTPEFKRMAYDQITSGKTMREVFEEHGIDPEILGDSRIWGFAEKLRAKAEREEGFTDLRGQNMRKPVKETKEQTLKVRVEQLEHELAYTRQEVEFLKKIHTADLEARKLWESKQRQK